MPVTKGQRVRFTGAFADLAGAPTDPTMVTFTVLRPDGTTQTYTYAGGDLTKSGVGVYFIELTLSVAGTWSASWTGAGALIAYDEFDFAVLKSRFG